MKKKIKKTIDKARRKCYTIITKKQEDEKMMTAKVIFMIIMVFEFVFNIYYIHERNDDNSVAFWTMLYIFVRFFLFIWIVANRNFF